MCLLPKRWSSDYSSDFETPPRSIQVAIGAAASKHLRIKHPLQFVESSIRRPRHPAVGVISTRKHAIDWWLNKLDQRRSFPSGGLKVETLSPDPLVPISELSFISLSCEQKIENDVMELQVNVTTIGRQLSKMHRTKFGYCWFGNLAYKSAETRLCVGQNSLWLGIYQDYGYQDVLMASGYQWWNQWVIIGRIQAHHTLGRTKMICPVIFLFLSHYFILY